MLPETDWGSGKVCGLFYYKEDGCEHGIYISKGFKYFRRYGKGPRLSVKKAMKEGRGFYYD